MSIPESPTAALMAELIYLRKEVRHTDDLIQRYGNFLAGRDLCSDYIEFCRENPIDRDSDL